MADVVFRRMFVQYMGTYIILCHFRLAAKIEFQHGLLNSDPDILTHTRPIFCCQYREKPFGHSNWTTARPPPNKKKHGHYNPVKLPTSFFLRNKASCKYVSIWKVTVCRFPPWVYIVSVFMGRGGLLLGSEWSLSGGCYSSCSRGHCNGGHQMCNHLWSQKSTVLPD